MPRTVDHEQRREEIATALVRVAARDGLHAVTMRAVAAEANVSLRLVQYYFTSKAQLMLGALRHLERRSRQRWAVRVAALPDPVPPRLFVEAFFAEALPTDEQSRTFHLLGSSYAALAMTDATLAAEPFIANVDSLEHQLAEALERARADGDIAPDADVAVEAAHLVALSHGLSTGVLLGQRDTEEAMAIVRSHLDALFTGRAVSGWRSALR
ncbi:TetR/AcrR family transcriptional regulator [Amycolatopsis magusensis]|uniref:AcrR family transcriptional regulator n=1 Tax=Amycolatopsis magusensis TaxID=882444 RepID=A0ABS4PXY1_9PSEU|nr:TetR family transcriptional regulator C-terminal domain-containing protein [Amycolatopsis magusensis]MBP2183740.1 AcrR family transcriptional regulator [Amycolatopsis magusensis]